MRLHRILCLLLCLGCPAPKNTTPAAADASSPIPRGSDWMRELDSLAPNPFPPPSATWIARFDGLGALAVGLSVPGFASGMRKLMSDAPTAGSSGRRNIRTPSPSGTTSS